MEDKNAGGMREQRLRRQRINRMKTTIIMTIAIWMLVSMIFCIGLLVQTIRLSHKIDKMAENTVLVEQLAKEMEKEQGASASADVQSHNITATNEEPQQQEQLAGTEKDFLSDNLPQEGVPQKVYLTFDDGPSENTARILDVLKEKGIKATFFVVGREEEEYKELYQRIVAEGHTLGMHSYSHKYSVIYDSLESFETDFYQLQTYLTEVTGVKPTIMRFPGGSGNKVSNISITEYIRFLNEEDITYYDWNVASGDATSQAYTAQELIENVVQDVTKYDTSIVLMHDSTTKGTTVEALGPMIDQIQSMGMQLLPIDQNTKLIQHVSADSINE